MPGAPVALSRVPEPVGEQLAAPEHSVDCTTAAAAAGTERDPLPVGGKAVRGANTDKPPWEDTDLSVCSAPDQGVVALGGRDSLLK